MHSIEADVIVVGDGDVSSARRTVRNPSIEPSFIRTAETTTRPVDWPEDGPIDLIVQDLPHHSSTTEWWYLNCHMETTDGVKLSLFASFFRIVLEKDKETNAPVYAHALNWALVDADAERYYAESLVDPCAPEVGLQKLERGAGTPDPLLQQAMREILEKGEVPHPDRLIEGPILVRQDRLDLDF